jgi:hypothetical protein
MMTIAIITATTAPAMIATIIASVPPRRGERSNFSALSSRVFIEIQFLNSHDRFEVELRANHGIESRVCFSRSAGG